LIFLAAGVLVLELEPPPFEPLEPELSSEPHPAATRAAAARTGRMK
jgi:hypothetical protein